MEKIKIFRSAVGSMPSWGLINELQDKGVEVVGLDSNPLSFGFYLLKKHYVVPNGNQPEFIERLMELIDKERPNALVSGPEEELLTLAKNKKLVESKGTLVLCPDEKYVEICMNKEKLHQSFKELGVSVPKLFENKSSVVFPCVVKPKLGRGSTDVYIAKNNEELNFYIKKVKDPIIQEFIEGEEYTVDVVADKEGNAFSIVPRLRLATESGISVKGKTVYDKEIIECCRRLAKHLKLFGPSCIQCIRGREGLKFIEINTRFGGGSILSIKADPTIIPNLLKMIRGGIPEPSKGFKEGLIMLRYHSEVFITEENRIRGTK